MSQNGPIRIAIQSHDILGESPFWSEEEQAIYWVDIMGKKIKRYEPLRDSLKVWDTEDFPTAIALRRHQEGAVVVCAGGIHFFEWDGTMTPFVSPEFDMEGNRLNEAKCDPAGRLWVGSMQNNLNPDGSNRAMDRHSGALYRIDPDGTATRFTEHIFGISNTMAWDLKRKRFYFADSLRYTIFVFDYDHETGEVSDLKGFTNIPEKGAPDGSCLDAEGCLWNSRYGGSCVIRYRPDGTIDRILDLPATNITSCAFGGKDLRTLYVTTACNGLTEAEQSTNPHQGSLLAIDVDVAGMPSFRFGG